MIHATLSQAQVRFLYVASIRCFAGFNSLPLLSNTLTTQHQNNSFVLKGMRIKWHIQSEAQEGELAKHNHRTI